LHYLKLEAYDGAMVSTEWVITIDVTYDPPVLSDKLVDQKVRVGRSIKYRTPANNTVRGNQASISSPGLIYFGTVTPLDLFTFEPPFT
jgi:hypothetical protein